MQTQEPLRKSVCSSSSSGASPWTIIIGSLLAMAVMYACILHAERRCERDRRQGAVRMWKNEQRAREAAELRLAILTGEIREMRGETSRFHVSTDAGHDLFRGCMKDPSHLAFAPETMGWVDDPMIRFDNAEPVLSDPVVRAFLPGQTCRVAPASSLSIRRGPDVFILRIAVSLDDSYEDTCPDGTYVLVSDENEIVQGLVTSGCLKAAKAYELGL